MAADKGFEPSMHLYANILRNGFGVPVNLKESSRYFKMAADKGFLLSMLAYGNILLNGECEEVDKKEAARYFKMAANLGDLYAIKIYAMMLIEGVGIDVDKVEGFKYLRLTADIEDNQKKSIISKIYENEDIYFPNVPKDDINNIKKMLKENSIDSMYRCAIMLYEGDGIDVNKMEAAKYFKKAADKDHIESSYHYAEMIYEGDGIDVNKQEAAKYFKKAADNGHTKAMKKYSLMLDKGDGIELNKEEADKYYKMFTDIIDANSPYRMARFLVNKPDIKFSVTKSTGDKKQLFSVSLNRDDNERINNKGICIGFDIGYGYEDLKNLFALFFMIALIIAILQYICSI